MRTKHLFHKISKKATKKKQALTWFYCPSQEARLGDSRKLTFIDQSRFCNSHVREN